MSKTNSNSITSILISELNNLESDFRKKMLAKFREKENEIPDSLFFYDGTHSPLKLRTMGNKEVDIYARVPGKYKIYLMIEVKAGIYEDLQDSQKENGEYQKTSKEEKIPLFYIIPKAYTHKSELEFVENKKLGAIIEWEDILKIAQNCKEKRIIEQIQDFVELTEEDNYFNEEKNIKFEDLENSIEVNLYVKKILDECLKSINDKHFVQSQYEFGYYWNNDKYFLGYNSIKNNFTLSLDIAEDKSNTELGKNKDPNFYFLEGWYYIPFNNIENEQFQTLKNFKDNKLTPKKYINNININILDKLNDIDSNNLIDTFILLNLLNETYENIFKKKGKYELTKFQNDENGVGAFIDEQTNQKRKFFIGISPKLEDKKYWFSLAMELNNIKQKKEWYLDPKKEYAYFPINKEKLINCKSKKDLEEALEQEINNIIANI